MALFKNLMTTAVLTLLVCSVQATDKDAGLDGKVELFKTLKNVGVSQVVELPYETKFIANFVDKTQVYDLSLIEEEDGKVPEPQNLREMYRSSFVNASDREAVPALNYTNGKEGCDYFEAFKVGKSLVCYVQAYTRRSQFKIVVKNRSICTSEKSLLSHCFMFAHSVDDVVRAMNQQSIPELL